MRPNIIVKKIENVGREANTYLYHIVNNFNDLKRRVIFIQGNPFDHKGKDFIERIKLNNLKKSYYARSIIGGADKICFSKELIEVTNNDISKEKLKGTRWENTVFSDNKSLEEFAHRYSIPFSRDAEPFIVSWGAQFLVKRDDILKHPLKVL